MDTIEDGEVRVIKQETAEVGSFPALTIDYDLFEHYLEDSDLSDEEKRELIETLWGVVLSFVQLSFRSSSVQHKSETGCGQIGENTSQKPAIVVKSGGSLSQNTFAKSAERPKGEPLERSRP